MVTVGVSAVGLADGSVWLTTLGSSKSDAGRRKKVAAVASRTGVERRFGGGGVGAVSGFSEREEGGCAVVFGDETGEGSGAGRGKAVVVLFGRGGGIADRWLSDDGVDVGCLAGA